jgi:Methyltransferase domain
MKKQKAVVAPKAIDVKKDVADPQSYPWPLKDGSVSELTCIDVFEFVPGNERGKFMDEIYRVLVPGGKASFTVRYWNTAVAIQDYAYTWPPLCEQSFLYFNKGWREANGLKRSIKCDFDFTYGYTVEPNTAARSDETRSFSLKFYTNVVQALQILLVKRG